MGAPSTPTIRVCPMFEVIDIEKDKGLLCRSILQSLPDWFGIPEAINKYAADVEDLPVLGARSGDAIVGFIASVRRR